MIIADSVKLSGLYLPHIPHFRTVCLSRIFVIKSIPYPRLKLSGKLTSIDVLLDNRKLFHADQGVATTFSYSILRQWFVKLLVFLRFARQSLLNRPIDLLAALSEVKCEAYWPSSEDWVQDDWSCTFQATVRFGGIAKIFQRVNLRRKLERRVMNKAWRVRNRHEQHVVSTEVGKRFGDYEWAKPFVSIEAWNDEHSDVGFWIVLWWSVLIKEISAWSFAAALWKHTILYVSCNIYFDVLLWYGWYP